VLHELLGMLANLGHHCEVARRATAVERAAGAGAPASLVTRLMRLAASPSLPTPTFVLAMHALQTLLVSTEPMALFVRGNMGAECERLLRRTAAAKDGARTLSLLQLLLNVAAQPGGAAHLLGRHSHSTPHANSAGGAICPFTSALRTLRLVTLVQQTPTLAAKMHSGHALSPRRLC
jgi:hypothetical protein